MRTPCQPCRQAERKMGEMLAATERAKGVRMKGGTKGKTGGNITSPPAKPTLSEIGVTKRESAEAQMLAATERQKPGDYRKAKRSLAVTVQPTLSEIGVTKRESARPGRIRATLAAAASGRLRRVKGKGRASPPLRAPQAPPRLRNLFGALLGPKVRISGKARERQKTTCPVGTAARV